MLACGCAIQVTVPANRFDSPETLGRRWRVKLAGALGGQNDVVLSPDASASAPNTASPTASRGTLVRFDGGIGLFDNLDIDIRNFNELEAKYQLLGKPRLTAEAGNFALAITAGIGVGGDKSDGTGLFTGAYQEDRDEYFGDAALIAGYRLTDIVLLYSGPFARQIGYSGHYASGPTPSNLGPSTNYSGSVSSYGANFGIELGTAKVQCRAEWAYAQVKSGTLDTGQAYVGAQLAVNFGQF